MSRVKYFLNEHARYNRILPSSWSIYIHPPLAASSQTVSANTYP